MGTVKPLATTLVLGEKPKPVLCSRYHSRKQSGEGFPSDTIGLQGWILNSALLTHRALSKGARGGVVLSLRPQKCSCQAGASTLLEVLDMGMILERKDPKAWGAVAESVQRRERPARG